MCLFGFLTRAEVKIDTSLICVQRLWSYNQQPVSLFKLKDRKQAETAGLALSKGNKTRLTAPLIINTHLVCLKNKILKRYSGFAGFMRHVKPQGVIFTLWLFKQGATRNKSWKYITSGQSQVSSFPLFPLLNQLPFIRQIWEWYGSCHLTLNKKVNQHYCFEVPY